MIYGEKTKARERNSDASSNPKKVKTLVGNEETKKTMENTIANRDSVTRSFTLDRHKISLKG